MTTYKTGNPLGSVSPKDLFDNSESLDRAVNGVALIWKDRFNKSRLSWAGIEDRARIDTDAAATAAATAAAAIATAQAGEYRDEARHARDDAIAAASASGDFIFAETYADAEGKLPLPSGSVVEVGRDETHSGSRTRYLVEDGALKFAVDLDLLRVALARPDGASIVFNALGDTGAESLSVAQYLELGFVTPKHFGAHGIGDDTAAIQNMLDSKYKHLLIDSVYRVSSTLIQSQNYQKIMALPGADIIPMLGMEDKAVISASGNGIEITVNIDGEMIAGHGVSIEHPSKDYVVSQCRIRNLRSRSLNAFGIVSHSGLGGRIHTNAISNITADGDGQSGNTNGMSRGVMFLPLMTPTAETFIYSNKIVDIFGEEGDSIAIQMTPIDWDGVYPYPKSRVIAYDNLIKNWTRRALKNQASGTIFRNNVLIHDRDDQSGLSSDLYSISTYAGDGNTISGNDISCGLRSAIADSGLNVHTNSRNQYSNNRVRCDAGVVVYVDYGTNISLDGFTIDSNTKEESGDLFVIGHATNTSLTNTKVLLKTKTRYVVSTGSDSAGLVVDGLTVRDGIASRIVNAPGAAPIIKEVTSIRTQVAAGCIGLSAANSDGAVVRRNQFLFSGPGPIVVNAGSGNFNGESNLRTA